MSHFRSISSILMMIFLLSFLPACSDSDKIIRYDVPAEVYNLDPQFATDPTARLVISNSFDTLLHQAADGTLSPCAAESYVVSDDQLRYTFTLRPDAVWWSGSSADAPTPVTAHDFVFSFHRMFSPTAPSSYASSFFSLRNARDVLAGRLPLSELGVKALDDYTLEFTLDRPDSLLPEQLASTAAAPCNEEFFRSTRARYGLDLKSLQFNGPFYLRNWENEKGLLSLRSNRHYLQEKQVDVRGVDLYSPAAQDGKSIHTRFFDGETDACRIDSTARSTVEADGGSTVAFEDTVWVLALNQQNPLLANTDLRRAIGYALDRSALSGQLPGNLRTSSTLVAPAIGGAGHPYREFAGESSPVSFSQDLSRRSYQSALRDLGVDRIALTEVLVCDEDPQPLLAGFVQQGLASLSISTGLVRLPREELLARVRSGDYTIAILPLSAAYSSPDALLSYFRSDAENNFTAYNNSIFDQLLDLALAAPATEQYELFRRAEQQLLADCAVVPLYFETTYYAMSKGISNIFFSPFLSGTDFRSASKK